MNRMMFSKNQKMSKRSLFLILLLHYFFQTCHAKCNPSSCGIFPNITSPFRLKGGDSNNCGDGKFELTCQNDVASIYLSSHKYYVKAINYSHYGDTDNSTIRIVDASLTNDICSFPTFSAYEYNFTYRNPRGYPFETSRNFTHLTFMRCPHPLKNSSLFTEVTGCGSNNARLRYTYIKVGTMKASDMREACMVDLIVMTSWEFKDLSNVSLSEIHSSLLYGFELTVCPWCITSPVWDKVRTVLYSLAPILLVIIGLLCAGLIPPLTTIIGFTVILGLLLNTASYMKNYKFGGIVPLRTAFVSSIIICVPRFIVFPLAMWLLIYKFRTRHLSIFNVIESFLQSDNRLTSIRYSYSDIRKMTKDFRDKLGEGGYGSVYKGKLRSGHDVAVKLLGKSGANGQDFINEVATIGRIHHVNVVILVGYCAQGSNRALVYDFMPNGSLEKYLFGQEKMSSLTWETKFEIAVGVARGIEYLHRGCDIQILHFDIKPHNILLDDKFIPKISDFGLAKFYSTDKKTVTITTARGTIGYVAPELISRSIGAVSYKADVYSFGMLLMEMVGLKRDLKGSKSDSSQYFPCWIYEIYKQGKDIEIEKANESANSDSTNLLVRKMTIVGLWCIQMNPNDRPSMNKVLQMFEGDVEQLKIPNYPSQSTEIVKIVDESGITCSSDSLSMPRHDGASLSVEITIQE